MISAVNITETISLKQAWKALSALFVGFFMILLDQTIVAVATPDLQQDLAASINAVVWVTSIYLLCAAVPLLVTGRLGDRFGQRNVYLVGMIIFTASSLACGLATNMTMLIVARAVQGLGAAILTPQTMSIINRIFPREQRGKAMGMWGAVAGLASLAGPLLGGLIISVASWQWIFFINVPLGILCVVLVWLWVPRLERHDKQIDSISVVLSVLAVFVLVFGFQEGAAQNFPWWFYVCVLAGVILTALFIWRQKQVASSSREPLVPLSMFSNKNFSRGSFAVAMMGFCVAAQPLPLMLFLQQGHHLGALSAACLLIPQAVLTLILSPYVGRLADRMHPGKLARIGFGGMAVSVLILAVLMRPGVSFWWILLPITIQGLANPFVWAPTSTTAMRDFAPMQAGAASGVYNTTRQLGSVIGAALVGAAMDLGVRFVAFEHAMGNAVLLAAFALVLGLVAASRFVNTPAVAKVQTISTKPQENVT